VSKDLAVLVPVLGRPHRVAPTLTSFYRTAPSCRVLFIADPDDSEELEAIRAEGAKYITPGGSYASKINAGVRATAEPFVFTAADDLLPHEGWFEAAVECISAGVEVVGANDLIQRRPRFQENATHFLLTRKAAEEPCLDGSPGPMFSGYVHNYPDRELVETARRRETYAYCPEAVVEHLHPMNGKAEMDSTYERGSATMRADSHRFVERKALWR
jgi:hypothetical protein